PSDLNVESVLDQLARDELGVVGRILDGQKGERGSILSGRSERVVGHLGSTSYPRGAREQPLPRGDDLRDGPSVQVVDQPQATDYEHREREPRQAGRHALANPAKDEPPAEELPERIAPQTANPRGPLVVLTPLATRRTDSAHSEPSLFCCRTVSARVLKP